MPGGAVNGRALSRTPVVGDQGDVAEGAEAFGDGRDSLMNSWTQHPSRDRMTPVRWPRTD
jgi:hypothetical protein